MLVKLRMVCLLALGFTLASALPPQGDPAQIGAYSPGQNIADELRTFTAADGAFVPAGMIRGLVKKDALTALIDYGTEEVVVVNLKGSQIRRAFEASLSTYPLPNPSFLQIAGFEVTFDPEAKADRRVVTILANGSRLEENRTYTVAMPRGLGRGGYGYFVLWERDSIVKTFEGATMESILRGKRTAETSPRWSPVRSS